MNLLTLVLVSMRIFDNLCYSSRLRRYVQEALQMDNAVYIAASILSLRCKMFSLSPSFNRLIRVCSQRTLLRCSLCMSLHPHYQSSKTCDSPSLCQRQLPPLNRGFHERGIESPHIRPVRCTTKLGAYASSARVFRCLRIGRKDDQRLKLEGPG